MNKLIKNPRNLSNLRINSKRMKEDFNELSAIGKTDHGGIHRLAFSRAHLEAREWFKKRTSRMGLEAKIDGAGNHSAFHCCGPEDGSTILMGSHLDSVPFGGRFDGALGVVAALEVIETVKDHNISLEHHLGAIDFTDEEGTFVGLMGSRAMAGILPEEEISHPIGDGAEFKSALEQLGITHNSILSVSLNREPLAGYLELHVEQGRRLKDTGNDIGVVTGIVGIRSFRITFTGRSDHAGTTPMNRRKDPVLAAAAFALSSRELVMENFPEFVITIGDMSFVPGAFNVVPESVTVSIEFRADTLETFDKMETAVLNRAEIEAGRFKLGFKVQKLERTLPKSTDERFQKAITGSADILGVKSKTMTSGAGHDAQAMAQICPIGMIFVPSEEGASHSEREFTRWEDCENGANVLLHTAIKLAGMKPV